VEQIRCLACAADPHAHYMHPVGFDRLGRPVLYSCLQLAANRSVEDNRLHMIATFEQVHLLPATLLVYHLSLAALAGLQSARHVCMFTAGMGLEARPAPEVAGMHARANSRSVAGKLACGQSRCSADESLRACCSP
jgi:hypothetical protein